MLGSVWNLFGHKLTLNSSPVSGTTKPNRFGLESLEDRTTPALFNPTTVAELIADINTANSNADVDTIDLGGATFTLTAIDNYTEGDNGLPSILADGGNALTITNGAIERDATAADDFRLFRVAAGADLTLSRVTLQGGLMSDASGFNSIGGAIRNAGDVTFSESLITSNQAFRFGGAILNLVGASVTIESSTLSNNMAGGGAPANQGGAIFNNGSVSIRNSTLSGNTATSQGGAIYSNGAITGIYNSTIADNTASEGGGIFTSGSITTLASTIVAGNTATGGNGPDIRNGGTITTASNNLIESANGHSITNGMNDNIVGSPANPGPLQNNGGPTPTHALLAGSLAINAGANPLALTNDQRGTGFAREIGGQTDIGAFELQEADIAVKKSASSNPARPGDILTFTVVVTNNGPDPDMLVNVTDIFPLALENVAYTSVATGGASGNTGAGAGNLFDTLNMPAGSSVAYTVTGSLPEDMGPGAILNTATVAGSFDPNPNNNADSVEVAIDSSIFAPGTNERFIENLYRDVLGRNPDPQGFAGWVNLLNEGASRAEVVDGIQDSEEHLTRRVTVLYLQLLHREPDADGLAGWVQFLFDGNSIGTVTSSILASAEYASLHPTPNDFMTALYVDLLGRLPSAEELTTWTSSGLSNQEIVDGFLDSPERITKTIERFYVQFLNRQADPSGLTGFTDDVLDGDLTLNGVVGSILSSDEYYNLVRPAV